jgi:hypothetical protein
MSNHGPLQPARKEARLEILEPPSCLLAESSTNFPTNQVNESNHAMPPHCHQPKAHVASDHHCIGYLENTKVQLYHDTGTNRKVGCMKLHDSV